MEYCRIIERDALLYDIYAPKFQKNLLFPSTLQKDTAG